MGDYITKRRIIKALTNLYDNFNDYCKLPHLAETANHIWGKGPLRNDLLQLGVGSKRQHLTNKSQWFLIQLLSIRNRLSRARKFSYRGSSKSFEDAH